jgi:hypothetical protein
VTTLEKHEMMAFPPELISLVYLERFNGWNGVPISYSLLGLSRLLELLIDKAKGSVELY